ncbi:MAG TPA: SpoIID/LytB domain-containing protein [Gemmatimonadales bacterium]|nr:SpoIID/LytB domain-containing protein [Gemmatimonadales bacterium]
MGLGVELAEVTLGGDGELFLTDDRNGAPIGAIPAATSWTVLPDSAGLRLVRPDGSRTAPYRGISAVNVSEGRYAAVQGRRYHGRIGVFRDRAGLTIVNRVPLEAYVASVIGGEMGRRRPEEIEALLTQAVVSRTFALRNRGRWESLGFDVYGDVRDQAYGGVATESPQTWEATRRTVGQVLTYDGELVDAYFHSTCGFSTAGVEEAFHTARRRPYLRPVSDARDGGGRYYCEISPRFRWREEWDAAKLRAILTHTLPAVSPLTEDGIEAVTDVSVGETTRSGRVGELVITFRRREVRVAAPDVRRILRPEPERFLGSTAFQLHVTRNGAGELTRLVAAGAGWGHGVGLCQWGAVGRARAGQGYRQILGTYFPGTKVERLY